MFGTTWSEIFDVACQYSFITFWQMHIDMTLLHIDRHNEYTICIYVYLLVQCKFRNFTHNIDTELGAFNVLIHITCTCMI